MAVGVDEVRVTGRLVFDLARGSERTARVIEIPNAITDAEAVQTAVNKAESVYAGSAQQMNLFVQPLTWRDTNSSEAQWTTTGVHYEIVTTVITPVEPDEPVSLAGGRSDEAQAEERSQEERNEPQGEWQG